MKTLKKLIGLGLVAAALYFSPLGFNEARAEATNKPFRGLCYGPFREGQSPEWAVYPTEAQIRDDLTNKLVFLTGKIRTYGNENILFRIPEFCRDAGIDCYPGAWVNNVSEDTNQINRLIQIGKTNYPTTKGLVVGSECLYRNPGMENQIISWVNQVKAATGKPVSVNEQWHIYRDYPNMVNAVDFGMINIYPFWEGQSIENAAAFILEKYNFIKNKYPTKKFIIGETGWPSAGPANGVAVPSLANQEKYMKDFRRIARDNGIDYTSFEATDEPWKGEGGVGGNWGVLDKNRNLKQSTINYLSDYTTLSNSSTNKVSVQTYEGDRYSLEKIASLASTNWTSVTNFIGKAGTNATPLTLGASVTTNKVVFLRARLNL
jgi:exo-beta-1,3-glucanase (GH17 family)